MKLASNMDGLIWVIIFVVVALVKGFTKLQKPADEDTTDSDEPPPVAPPRTSRPRLQPRPMAVPAQRTTATLPRTAAPMGPRPIAAPASEARRIGADEIRRFIEQLSGQPAAQTPVAPPPVPSAAPPPLPSTPEPVPNALDTRQTIVDTPLPTQSILATQWAQALRDRQNIRNIIIANEIIGPPRGESG